MSDPLGEVKEELRRQVLEESRKPRHRLEKKGVWGVLAALGAILAKFKSFLFLIFKLKFLTTSGTMLLSVALYSWAWGWPFAVGVVLLIFTHEMGHAVALWRRGIRAGMPVFIPFMGAFISMKEMPQSVAVEAETAFAGPLIGTLATMIPYAIAHSTGNPFWMNLAYTGFMINLFNLLPVLPLDGGRVAAALSPKVWIAGIAAAGAWLFYRFNPFLLLLVILSLPRMMGAFKGNTDPSYYEIPYETRVTVFIGYFGLALFLGSMLLATYIKPQ